MAIRFEGSAVFVSSMLDARTFYEQTLGQTVLFAVGDQYIAYEGGFSLWHHQNASESIHGTRPAGPATLQGHENFELYFETEELEDAWARTRASCSEPIHAMREMPWGQHCFRVRDPDGHIVEVAEPMSRVMKRLLDSGLTPEEVAKRTMTPLGLVQAMCGCQEP